jgi:hypothetical protein
MKNAVLGVVISSVVLFLWGFVYWGMGPYGRHIWKHAADDEQAAAALRAQFPENGTYMVPAVTHEPATLDRLSRRGPVALVHVLAAEGRPPFDPLMMVQGFAFNVAVIVMIAVLLHLAMPALPTFARRAQFVLVAGLLALLVNDVGDVVWWRIDWPWKAYQAVYTFTEWAVPGLILAALMHSKAPAE